MKILVATDAWLPQINGVVATYMRLASEAPALGASLAFLTPDDFRTVAMPMYPEIWLAVPDRRRAMEIIDAAAPDHIHIATEGPVGWMARDYCLRRGLAFTTSFHTRFPEYAAAHAGLPRSWTYAALRRFHGASAGVMVATPTLQRELAGRGFANLLPWTRGVDADLFRPRHVRLFGNDGPVFLYAGRVSREKNIEAFLDADLPGIKAVVGDGPHLKSLAERYPAARFAGCRTGEDLARHFASADVFVFPSRTDTFGLVILEALASGLPVAAYPATGPVDIVEQGVSGILDADLGAAARRAIGLDRRAARARALKFTWQRTAEMFIGNIRLARGRTHVAVHSSGTTKFRAKAEQACAATAIRRT